MIEGWLVVNHFLQTPQFTHLYDRFLESACSRAVSLQVKTNVEVAVALAGEQPGCCNAPDFVLFWDKDVRLCERLELLGLRTFNCARAIEICDDKVLTYQVLAASGRIPQPESLVAPKVFGREDWGATDFPDAAISRLGLPLVLKEAFGSFGEQVRLAHTREEVVRFLGESAGRPALLQRFVCGEVGADMRLQMVGGQLVAAMKRRSADGDFRSNIVNGGTAERYVPDSELVRLARSVCEIIGLDFAGVDFLFDEQSNPVVCEVNSNAHFATLERVTGADVATAIIQHVERSIGER